MPNISIITPKQLYDARREFGLSTQEFAEWIKVSDARTVRRWEDETRDIPGPVGVLVLAALDSKAVRKHFGLTTRAERLAKEGIVQ